MKQAVLYVCHGSRVKKACAEAIAFIKRCQQHIEADIQEICFLELASPSIEQGFASCVKQGATHIAVVPLLLLTAVHAKEDIPCEVKIALKKHPNVKVTYGKPIGVHEKMASSVLERVSEQGGADADSVIVLIGRGSSDPDVIRDLQAIGELVKDKSGIKDIRTCYLTAAKPSFDEMLDSLSSVKDKTIFIVPYLLFTGLLMQEIEAKVTGNCQGNLTLCRYLGYDSKVEQVFTERIIEAVDNKGSFFSFQEREDNHAAVND
ncbi:sirohydrochlorin chelatase [Metabacillus idriensis]|uniref:sirohydrochlorin chelatase n=1 Tax=Metabacillus idriensis TaxID=324768 RepID=UPI00163A2860|nr:sirohydrochlorin chelatase [Metabacillus idriensis]QNG58834.1 sirohydrochlorin chelatase [Bacillus sp. PAMC26568]